ncbi:MAG: hypothetical protein WA747_07450, partial [Steroidobacteraceae bacterium]
NPLTQIDPSGFINLGLTHCIDACPVPGPHGWGFISGGIGGNDWGAVGAGAGSVDEMDEVMADNPTVQSADFDSAVESALDGAASTANNGSGPNQAGTGDSDLGNALRHVPLVGGLLGAAGDVLSGIGNIAGGTLTLDSSQFQNGFSEFAGGIGSAAQIGFTDLAAGLVGAGAYVYNNLIDVMNVLTLGYGANNYNPKQSSATAVLNLIWNAAVPDYGMFGGPNWGTTQYRTASDAMNYIDYISWQHDQQFSFGPGATNASANWVGAGLSSIPSGQIAPGPIGIAYFLLGTPPFLATNAVLGH